MGRRRWPVLGAAITTVDLEEAFEIASETPSEHLELLLERPTEHPVRVRHGGAFFPGAGPPRPRGTRLLERAFLLSLGGAGLPEGEEPRRSLTGVP